ncbi:hypothetical protein, partial [Serratia marcescens]|uniref:hypothetical protein n=1 Tax=Serratia marcescens TaxID=615 RepID=UPI0028141DB3
LEQADPPLQDDENLLLESAGLQNATADEQTVAAAQQNINEEVPDSADDSANPIETEQQNRADAEDEDAHAHGLTILSKSIINPLNAFL